ncbi:hypothetical protein AAFC00_005227 [Neodothiora populina]
MDAKKSGGKVQAESAYPSPIDEMNDSIIPSSPVSRYQHKSPNNAGLTLPPLHEALQHPMSPSTSPHMPAGSYNGFLGSPVLIQNGNFYNDPQLFPEQTRARATADEHHPPLFPPPTQQYLPKADLVTKITPRQRKCVPFQAPESHPSEPARPAQSSIWAMAIANPVKWYQDRREEDENYWPSVKKTGSQGTEMVRKGSSQGNDLSPRLGKRTADRRDSAAQGLSAKRQRRREGQDTSVAGTRTTPREAPLTAFDMPFVHTTPKPERKPTAKRATPAPHVKKTKPTSDEPDVHYNLYKDYTPNVRSLDDPKVNFVASWGGKPLNLDSDPDRGLLHDKEVKLATKLALTCSRYLYLKRRFFAGRLEFEGRKQTYNINAAQQQCKGPDVHGVVGADVNKTSSMWKAFNSVGWLESSHMQPYLTRVV